MTRSRTPSRGRALPLAAAAALIITGLAPTQAAQAASDVTLANGCVVVGDPTPEHHTDCSGLTFTMADFTADSAAHDLSALVWDYADLTGATIESPVLTYSGSKHRLVLDDAVYSTPSPLLSQGEGSVASAVDAVLGVPGGTLFVGPSVGPPEFAASMAYLGREDWTGPLADFSGGDFRGSTWHGSVMYLDLSGADLTGVSIDGGRVADLNLRGATLDGTSIAAQSAGSFDLLGADVTNSSLPAMLGNSRLRGLDLREVTWLDDAGAPTTSIDLGGSDLRDTVWSGLELDSPRWGGSKFAGLVMEDAVITGDLLFLADPDPSELVDGVVLDGTTVTGDLRLVGGNDRPTGGFSNLSVSGVTVGGDLEVRGQRAAGADLSGADVAGWVNLAGSDLLRADLTGLKAQRLDVRGTNLTSATFTGIEIDDITGSETGGGSFAYADMEGVDLFLGANLYWGTRMAGADLVLLNSGGYAITESDLTGARLHVDPALDWASLNGVVFTDSTLDGARIEAPMNGAVLRDTSAVGASFQSDGLLGLGGLRVIDSDLTDSTWPAAANTPGDPGKWWYGLMLLDSELKGTAMVPDDVAVVTTGLEPAAVNLPITGVWANDDDQSPYAADGGYWWGSKLTGCTVADGALLPVGHHDVTCWIGFDHQVNPAPTTWSSETFDRDAPGGTGAFQLTVMGIGAKAQDPGPDMDLTTMRQLTTDPMALAPQTLTYTTDSDQLTSLNEVTFGIDVQAAPVPSLMAQPVVVGQPAVIEAEVSWWPLGDAELTGLPDGLSVCDEQATGITTVLTVCGSPAPGTGGSHTLTLTATNAVGEASVQAVLEVAQAPEVTLQATGAAGVGQPLPLTASVTWHPAGIVSADGLPDGVELCGTEALSDGSTGLLLCGVPAPGTGGSHTVTVSATNSAGQDAAVLTVWVAEPRVMASIDPLQAKAGDEGELWCEGMTPQGEVSLTVAPEGGDLVELLTGTADEAGLSARYAGTAPDEGFTGEAVCADAATGLTTTLAIDTAPAEDGPEPTPGPSPEPSPEPSSEPTPEPSPEPSTEPTPDPTTDPSPKPSDSPGVVTGEGFSALRTGALALGALLLLMGVGLGIAAASRGRKGPEPTGSDEEAGE